jgi:hypothetical protein
MLKGRPLPTWFLEEPIIRPGEKFYLQAFWDLSSCRSIGMSLGPIPWTAAWEYGKEAGLDEELLPAFWYFLRVMDSAYLDWQDQEAKKRREANTPKTGRRPKEGG